MTHGTLTTFSIANDVAEDFAIIPAMFLICYPQLLAPAQRHEPGQPGRCNLVGHHL
jgi:hypothetical protein